MSVPRAQRSSVQICAEGREPLQEKTAVSSVFLSGICDEQISLNFLSGWPDGQLVTSARSASGISARFDAADIQILVCHFVALVREHPRLPLGEAVAAARR